LSEQAYERYHSTAQEAATIAQQAQAKQLIIGHFSSRYKNTDGFLEEAKAVFDNTHIAEEGITYFIEDTVPISHADII
jgi:ribonuclease Z